MGEKKRGDEVRIWTVAGAASLSCGRLGREGCGESAQVAYELREGCVVTGSKGEAGEGVGRTTVAGHFTK